MRFIIWYAESHIHIIYSVLHPADDELWGGSGCEEGRQVPGCGRVLRCGRAIQEGLQPDFEQRTHHARTTSQETG